LGFRGRAAGERSERTPKAQTPGTQPPPGRRGHWAAMADQFGANPADAYLVPERGTARTRDHAPGFASTTARSCATSFDTHN
jgi:hypothetical protein